MVARFGYLVEDVRSEDVIFMQNESEMNGKWDYIEGE